MNVIPKFHDDEIIGIYHYKDSLTIILNNNFIILRGIKYWDFTPFDEQNIIFELNYFNINKIPDYIREEYLWISNYKSLKNLKILEIDSSVGLSGIAVFDKISIKCPVHPSKQTPPLKND